MEERLKPLFYILPAYAAIVIFVVYPAILTVTYSFQTKVGFPTQEWVGLQNYKDLLGNEGFRDTLLNTLLWIAVVPAVDRDPRPDGRGARRPAAAVAARTRPRR